MPEGGGKVVSNAETLRQARCNLQVCCNCGWIFAKRRAGSGTQSKLCEFCRRGAVERQPRIRWCKECGKRYETHRGSRAYCRSCGQKVRQARERAQRAVYRAKDSLLRPGYAPQAQKGALAESMFDVFAIRHGWTVGTFVGDGTKAIDRIVLRNGNWETVQVKAFSGERGHGKQQVDVQRTNKHYAPDAFDLLAVVHILTGDVWLMPWSDVNHLATLRVLGEEYDVYRGNIMEVGLDDHATSGAE